MPREQGRRIPVVLIAVETGYTQQFENEDEPIPSVGDILIRLNFNRNSEAARVVVTERTLVYSNDDRLLSVTLKVRDARDSDLMPCGDGSHG
jgi:hypothetical protein